jgi:hypothetical protein
VQVYMLDGLGELLIFDDLSHALDMVNLLNINSDNNTNYKVVKPN